MASVIASESFSTNPAGLKSMDFSLDVKFSWSQVSYNFRIDTCGLQPASKLEDAFILILATTAGASPHFWKMLTG
jgi:hypothetical protein